MDKLVKQATIAYVVLLLSLVGITFKSLSAHAAIAIPTFVEGTHYTLLDKEATIEPEVKVFYTPYCKPCSVIHKPLQTMAKRAGIAFYDVPVNFGPLAAEIQKSIAAANQQGIVEPYVSELIQSIHFRPSTAPQTKEDLAEMIERCGGNATDFRRGCAQIRQDVKNFDKLTKEYYVAATPTIIVNGNKRINLAHLKSLKELNDLLISLSEV